MPQNLGQPFNYLNKSVLVIVFRLCFRFSSAVCVFHPGVSKQVETDCEKEDEAGRGKVGSAGAPHWHVGENYFRMSFG